MQMETTANQRALDPAAIARARQHAGYYHSHFRIDTEYVEFSFHFN